IVEASQRYERAAYLARKQRDTFVDRRATVERRDTERHEISRLDQLRQDVIAVVRRVGREIGDATVVVAEAHEASVFHALALGRARGKDHSLRDLRIAVEGALVVGRR